MPGTIPGRGEGCTLAPTVAFTSLAPRVLEAWPIPLAVTARDGVILFVNRALEATFAYDKGELVGQRLDVVLPGWTPALQAAALGRQESASPAASRREQPAYARRKDGSRFVVVLAVNGLRAGDDMFLVALARVDNACGAASGPPGVPPVPAAVGGVDPAAALLAAENLYLRQAARAHWPMRVVARSPLVRQALRRIERLARQDGPVLLVGEPGTGKHLLATRLHELSARSGRTMVRVNCAAIPAALLEGELFGREQGAFTGALTRQIGRLELADQSTLFLDGIGELPPRVQVKLLRFMEGHTVERLGGRQPTAVDVRIVAATHRDLGQLVADGRFLRDLYDRLNACPIHLPPLRDRPEDLELLVWRFVEEFGRAFGTRIDSIDREDLAAVQRYAWPGNLRELRNAVEQAMMTATSPRLRVALPRRAAARLGLEPTTLETRTAKLGLRRPDHA